VHARPFLGCAPWHRRLVDFRSRRVRKLADDQARLGFRDSATSQLAPRVCTAQRRCARRVVADPVSSCLDHPGRTSVWEMDEAQDEQPSGMDIFVMEMGVSPSYMLDDDDQPAEPTIVLDIKQHMGSGIDGQAIRVHLAASAVAELAGVMQQTAMQSVVNAAAAKREAGQP
jgi:hypothetical protein